MGKTIDIGGRLHSTEQGNVVAGANEIYDDTKGKKQDVINGEVDAALEGLDQSKQDNLTFDQTPTESSPNPVTSGGVYAADAVLQQAIEAILTLIPSAASALNKLADKQFVNSSIATSTATFRGTYNLVSDLHLSVTASHADIATALASVVSSADNQDYAFVQVPTSDTSSDIRVTERYKFNGEVWMYEYDLNNSGFTAQQWEAINSTITLALVQKLGALPTAAELATLLLGKQNVLTFDNVPTSGSANPVKSGGLYEKFTAIDAKIPSDADANNKLVAENRLAAYVGTIIEALDASFNLTSADGHVTFRLTQADGQITSVQIATDDIASDAALTALGGRVSTNERDIDALQDAYAALTQSDIVVVDGALPSSGQQQNIIYRQPDQDHTPPQFYSDYMWNGTTWVLMATYNNAIDPRPKKGSQNLVTSGGVFDNMGALDVSELNATENPHTLATYADLSAALAAIPSDYQKGGMSIKFVQTSDNKYVMYRLMTDDWSTDTDDWAIADKGFYVENPEFIYVETDAEGKILWAIKTDGSIYYGAGCPQQVKDYIEEKISSLSLDEYEDIVAFLSDYLGSDTTLKTLLDSKLDAEGLDPEALAIVQAIENPEYIQVTTDSENKILEGITSEGVKQINLPIDTPAATIEYVENPEYAQVAIDKEDKILEGITKKGEKIFYIPIANLPLTEGGMKKLQEDLIEAGFNPGGSTLPEGGYNGEVLATDGNGNYYWITPPTSTTTDVSQTFGVLVDQYESENTGISWTPAIQKAIQEAGIGGTIVFTPNKTYNISDTIYPLKDQVFIGNGATLKRMNESKTTTTTEVTISGTTSTITVDSVPSDWKHGDAIYLINGNAGQSGVYIGKCWIDSINGNAVSVYAFTPYDQSSSRVIPAGAIALKSFVMMEGSQMPNPISYKVFNLVFDGNKDNNDTLITWGAHGCIYVFGFGSVIRDCKFLNVPTENIVAQGLVVQDCYAENLNGSFVHLSCPAEERLTSGERYMGTFIIGNICKGLCATNSDVMGHSQAAIANSWNPGKLTVIGNQFYGEGATDAIPMNVHVPTEPESPSEYGSGGYVVYMGNIFDNFLCIGKIDDSSTFDSSDRNRIITNNIFKDCNHSDLKDLYKVGIRFEDNLYEGNTTVDTDDNTLMLRTDKEISTTPSSSTLTEKYGNIPIGGCVYVTQIGKSYKKLIVNNQVKWAEEIISFIN